MIEQHVNYSYKKLFTNKLNHDYKRKDELYARSSLKIESIIVYSHFNIFKLEWSF